jgi:hypothetical protein
MLAVRQHLISGRRRRVFTAIIGVARGNTLSFGAAVGRFARHGGAEAVVGPEQKQNRHDRDGYVDCPAHSCFTVADGRIGGAFDVSLC